MEWKEVKAAGRWQKIYKAEKEGLSITAGLQKHDNAAVQAWDVILKDGEKEVGRTVIHDNSMACVLEKAVCLMKEHLAGKLEHHRANYEKWQSCFDRFERNFT